MSMTDEVLLQLLKSYPRGLTRGELKAKTGLPRTTLYDTLIRLWIKSRVNKVARSNGKKGRSNVYWYAV